MILPTLLVSLLAAGGADASTFVSVAAAYLPPAKAGGDAAISITFQPLTPDVQVDQDPAPRLSLDTEQKVLVARPSASRGPGAGPADKYVGPLPVVFPVALGPGAGKGTHAVKGSLTFFYCSTAAGWCRKGTADLSVDVAVR